MRLYRPARPGTAGYRARRANAPKVPGYVAWLANAAVDGGPLTDVAGPGPGGSTSSSRSRYGRVRSADEPVCNRSTTDCRFLGQKAVILCGESPSNRRRRRAAVLSVLLTQRTTPAA